MYIHTFTYTYESVHVYASGCTLAALGWSEDRHRCEILKFIPRNILVMNFCTCILVTFSMCTLNLIFGPSGHGLGMRLYNTLHFLLENIHSSHHSNWDFLFIKKGIFFYLYYLGVVTVNSEVRESL